jgi:hypothetical protein
MPKAKHRGHAVKGPKRWLSVPDAGRIYYGLSRNGSYDAAERGEIPTVRVGRLLLVPVQAMEAIFDRVNHRRASAEEAAAEAEALATRQAS